MDIAAELQQEANERAGSLEGFQQVIRLVLDEMEGKPKPLHFVIESDLHYRPARPEWTDPEDYLSIFRDYVCCMQEALYQRRHVESYDYIESTFTDEGYGRRAMLARERDEVEYKAAQKKLSELIHAAKSKKRELPLHAYKRLLAVEDRNAVRFHGLDNLYLPHNWVLMSEAVEFYISDFGTGRERVGHDTEARCGDN